MKWYSKTVIALLMVAMAQFSYAQDRSNKAELAEENVLIVQIAVAGAQTEENVEVYQHEGGYLVPLGFLAQFIDFAIVTHTDNGQANGWFIRENQNFLLDANKRTVVVAGKEMPIGTRMVIVGSEDIYVDSSLFSEWFPIDLELNFARLVLQLKPRVKLPFQEREERKANQGRMSRVEKKQNNFQKIETPAQNFTIPMLNIDLGNEFNSKSSPQNNASYSILAQGDAAKFSTNLFVSGDGNNNPSSARLRAGNKDDEGKLLGKLGATEYSIGDIESASVPLVGGNGHGRGVYISNTDMQRPDQFDQTNFVGDSQPGWEVEVYRNGELLGFQTVGDNGRYEFRNIPVLYGNNNFKVVSYGPQGQVKEEVKSYSIDDSILKKGTFNYQVSADEKSSSLFGIDETVAPPSTPKSGRFIGNFTYGLTERITASTGLATTPLEDNKTHTYQTFGLNSSIGGMFSSLNTAYDYENKGVAGQAVINTSIKDISTRLEHKQFHNFVSEEESATSDRRTSTDKIDLNGMISNIIPSGLSYGLGAQQEKYESNHEVVTYSNRLSTTVLGIGLGNNLQSVKTKSNGTITELDTGEFSMRGNYHQVFVRLSTIYNISPISEVQSVNLSLQKDLENKMNLHSDIKKDLSSSSDLTTVNVGLTKEYDYYRVSALSSADSADNYTVGVRLSFSAGVDPSSGAWFASSRDIANEGAISASAFLDNNYNGTFDDGDKVLENVGFQKGGQKFTPKEGGKTTLITGVDSTSHSDIEVNTATIEDPFIVPSVKGYSVKTRPGVITPIIFPVAYTTEIDGTVYHDKDGQEKPLSHAIVELVDSNGKVVSTAKSEYDGFYVLSNVIPGEYQVRLSRETLDKIEVVISPQVNVKIEPKSDFISGIDIKAVSGHSEDVIIENPFTGEEEVENGPILPKAVPSVLKP